MANSSLQCIFPTVKSKTLSWKHLLLKIKFLFLRNSYVPMSKTEFFIWYWPGTNLQCIDSSFIGQDLSDIYPGVILLILSLGMLSGCLIGGKRQIHCYLLVKFTGYVQRHMFSSSTPPPPWPSTYSSIQTVTRKWPDSESTQLLACKDLGGGGGLKQKISCRKVLCRLLIRQRDFALPSMSLILQNVTHRVTTGQTTT
jgi:hypothetical protein